MIALRGALLAAIAAVIAGCDDKDGIDELAAGKAAYEVHDLKKAVSCFEKSASRVGTNAEVYVCLARARLDLGELGEARQAIGKAVELEPDALDVRLLGAQIAWHSKNYEAALTSFLSVANDNSLKPDIRSQGWTGVGIVEMTGNNYHAARLALLRAIGADRKNPAAWYHLGLLYRDGFGYPEAALEQFDFYVHLNQIADRRVQKVQRVLIPELKDTIARSAADRPGASKRNSAASSAALVKADEAFRKGQYKTAKARYQEALAADVLSYPAALGLARTWEKTDATKIGQQRALEHYRQACSLRPSAVSTFITAGALAMKLGSALQAVEIYSRAVAADPSNISALDGLVRAFRKTGTKANIKLAAEYDAYRMALPKRKK